MKCVIIGHSHINALVSAAKSASSIANTQNEVEFLLVRMPARTPPVLFQTDGQWTPNPAVIAELERAGAFNDPTCVYVSILGGNEHNVLGLLEHPKPFDIAAGHRLDAQHIPEGLIRKLLEQHTREVRTEFLPHLLSRTTGPFLVIETPPPIASAEHIANHLDPYFGLTREQIVVAPAELRMQLWMITRDLIQKTCADLGIPYIKTPNDSLADGFLAPQYWSTDATHANAAHGEMWLQRLHSMIVSGDLPARRDPNSLPHPYKHIPDHQRWSRAIAGRPVYDLDPVISPKFTIGPADRIATAGSCFAQHIARRLAHQGLRHYVAEKAHPMIPPKLAEEWGYGHFSCRFGNIYTARQLRQLFHRAFGDFEPQSDYWMKDKAFIDPFRPNIQPGGFISLAELHRDRQQHLAAVRRMFKRADVFIFTLGLTECWADKVDGAAFPICPGVLAGEFDPARHAFVNQRLAEVVEDLSTFIHMQKSVNPDIRIMLTVSPVPLAATAEPRHVLVSTTSSKAVLRVAVDEIQRQFPDVEYFPSYEIIASSASRTAYYSDDLREVLEDGVDHVMRVFFRHYAASPEREAPPPTPKSGEKDVAEKLQAIARAVCEEASLDQGD